MAREGAHVAAKYSSVSPGGAHPPPRAPCPPPPAGWTPPPPCASGPVTPPRPRVAGSFFTTRTASRRAFAAGPASAGCVRLDRPRPTPRALDLRLGSRVPQTRRRRHRAPFDSRATAPDLAPPESEGPTFTNGFDRGSSGPRIQDPSKKTLHTGAPDRNSYIKTPDEIQSRRSYTEGSRAGPSQSIGGAPAGQRRTGRRVRT